MKIKCYGKDRRVTVEDLRRPVNFYELGDGYHVIPPDSVYTDREGKRPPVVIMFEGLVAPYGTRQTNDFCDQTWYEMDIIKDSGGLPTISTPFSRRLGAYMEPIIKFGPVILTIVLVAYALLSNGGL